jgi:hypothetical protein
MKTGRKVEEQFLEYLTRKLVNYQEFITALTAAEIIKHFDTWRNIARIEYSKSSSALILNIVFLKSKFPTGTIVSSSEDRTLHTQYGNSLRIDFMKLANYFDIPMPFAIESTPENADIVEETKAESPKKLIIRRAVKNTVPI